MNPEQCNRLIAEKVMEFEDCGSGKAHWYDPETGDFYGGPFEDFDPYHNPTHAHMALEKFTARGDVISLAANEDTTGPKWMCRIWTEGAYYEGFADTPSAAICEAIAEVVKG
jgi:hypothetical protein